MLILIFPPVLGEYPTTIKPTDTDKLIMKLEELETTLLKAPDRLKASIKKSIAMQLSGCFLEFCRQYNLKEEWHIFYRAVFCDNASEDKKDIIDSIFSMAANKNAELDEFEKGTTEALEAAYLLQKDTEKSYCESIASYCHFIGSLNIQYRQIDIDWVEPNYELDDDLLNYINHYLEFISGTIDETRLYAQSSFNEIKPII